MGTHIFGGAPKLYDSGTSVFAQSVLVVVAEYAISHSIRSQSFRVPLARCGYRSWQTDGRFWHTNTRDDQCVCVYILYFGDRIKVVQAMQFGITRTLSLECVRARDGG